MKFNDFLCPAWVLACLQPENLLLWVVQGSHASDFTVSLISNSVWFEGEKQIQKERSWNRRVDFKDNLLVRNYFLNINFVVHACLNFTVHWIYEDIYFHRSPRKDIFTACCDKWTALLVKCVRSLFKNEAPRHQPDRSLNCVHSQLDDFTPHCNSDSTNRTNPHIES